MTFTIPQYYLTFKIPDIKSINRQQNAFIGLSLKELLVKKYDHFVKIPNQDKLICLEIMNLICLQSIFVMPGI